LSSNEWQNWSLQNCWQHNKYYLNLILKVLEEQIEDICGRIVEEIGDISKRQPLKLLCTALLLLERYGLNVKNWGLTLILVGITVTKWRNIFLVTMVGDDSESVENLHLEQSRMTQKGCCLGTEIEKSWGDGLWVVGWWYIFIVEWK